MLGEYRACILNFNGVYRTCFMRKTTILEVFFYNVCLEIYLLKPNKDAKEVFPFHKITILYNVQIMRINM